MPMSRKLPSLAVAFACFLPAVSCAQAPQAAAPGAINPCTLLTDAEVSDVMGLKVQAGRPFDNGVTGDGAFSTTCVWAVALDPNSIPDTTKPLGGASFAILNILNWPGGPTDAQKYLDSFQGAFDQKVINSQPVPVEVGADQSLWWGDGVAGRKDGVSFGISVAQIADRDQRQPKAEQLARRVAQRLWAKPT